MRLLDPHPLNKALATFNFQDFALCAALTFPRDSIAECVDALRGNKGSVGVVEPSGGPARSDRERFRCGESGGGPAYCACCFEQTTS